MNLGSKGPGGDRAKLVRELDRLQAMGITNLRIMAASEGPDAEPWRMVPALLGNLGTPGSAIRRMNSRAGTVYTTAIPPR